MTSRVWRGLLFALIVLLAVVVGAIGTLLLTDDDSTGGDTTTATGDGAPTERSDQAAAYVADQYLDGLEAKCLSANRFGDDTADFCSCLRGEFADRFSAVELIETGLRLDEPAGRLPHSYSDDMREANRVCKSALPPG